MEYFQGGMITFIIFDVIPTNSFQEDRSISYGNNVNTVNVQRKSNMNLILFATLFFKNV